MLRNIIFIAGKKEPRHTKKLRQEKANTNTTLIKTERKA